jgi:polyphosphate kinase
VISAINYLPIKHYFNRELSWLKFNRRVLEEARNRKYPLLERLRFLSISGSNLDEFFMVRVAGLRGQQIRKIDELSIDGMTAGEQLEAITHDADALMAEQQKLWQHLRKQLANEGISVIEPGEIGKKAETAVEKHFRDQILPVLTPQALDPAHPFPFIPNKGLSLILEMRRLSDKAVIRQLIMIPPALPRFVRVPGPRRRFVTIEELIKFHIGLLFPDHKLLSAGAFRIIRDSDIEIEEEAEDLVRHYRSAIKRRRRGRVIRLKMQKGISAKLQKLVREALGGESSIVSETIGFLGIGDLAQLVDEDRKSVSRQGEGRTDDDSESRGGVPAQGEGSDLCRLPGRGEEEEVLDDSSQAQDDSFQGERDEGVSCALLRPRVCAEGR